MLSSLFAGVPEIKDYDSGLYWRQMYSIYCNPQKFSDSLGTIKGYKGQTVMVREV